MDIFLESFWPAIFICTLIDAVLIVLLLRTQKTWIVGLLMASSILWTALIALPMFVETDREQIEVTLSQLAAALEQNQPPRVMEFISPNAAPLRAQAQSALQNVHVDEALLLRGLEVNVDRTQSPATARAQFSGRFKGREKSGAGIDGGIALFRFDATFERDGDRWLVKECTWKPGVKAD